MQVNRSINITLLTVFLVTALSMSATNTGFAARYDAVDKYEAEDMIFTSLSEVLVIDNPGLSGDKGLQLKGAQIGDYIFFNKVNIKQHGLYNIKLGVRKGPDSGNIQLLFPDINTKVGAVHSLYNATSQVEEIDIGNQYCNVSDSRWFRFDVVGKDSKSSGYNMTIDYLLLTYLEEYKARGAEIPYFQDEQPQADIDASYAWGQVMEGGTGCSTHITFHQTEQDLIYMGTDMGGLYRWQPEQNSWKPLTDIFPYEKNHYLGIDSIALAESNPDIIYIACGTYHNKGEGGRGEVLKSTNRGESWTYTNFRQFFCANGDYRYYGECMAVDPLDENIVLVATMTDGIYKTTDGFETWEKLPDPIATTDKRFARQIVYDKNLKSDSGKTQRIYCGILESGVWVSENGGQSFSLLNGSPKNPSKLKIADDGTLAVSTEGEGLYKYKDGEWSNITPVSEGNFTQVAIDKHDSNYMVTAWHWGPVGSFGEYIYYTSDGGQSWRMINDDYIRNHYIPRVEWGGFFANVSDIAIDPKNSGRVMMVGWQNFYYTDNIFEENPIWTNNTRNVEHGVIREMHSGKRGARLMVSAYDYAGGRFTDVTQYPPEMLYPKQNPPRSAIMLENPNYMIRMAKNAGAYSSDNGISWKYVTQPVKDVEAVGAAISSVKNPKTGLPVFMALYSKNDPFVSFDLGNTWQIAKGAEKVSDLGKWDTFSYLCADGQMGNIFYYVSDNSLFKSEDYGVTFEKITAFSSFTTIKSVPNIKGNLWVISQGELLTSTSYGEMFNKMDGFSEVVSFGFGKGYVNDNLPTAYVFGKYNGILGMYRSVDMGKNWTTILDYDKASKKTLVIDVVGDMQTFGVVYMGTCGRGVWYGTPVGENPFYANRNDPIKVFVNNQTVLFDVSPENVNDRTMVSMRNIFEAVGANVVWDEKEQKVTATRIVSDNYGVDTYVIELIIGSDKMHVNGVEQTIDVEPIIVNGRTMVPVRFISQALGAKVTWDTENSIVWINI